MIKPIYLKFYEACNKFTDLIERLGGLVRESQGEIELKRTLEFYHIQMIHGPAEGLHSYISLQKKIFDVINDLLSMLPDHDSLKDVKIVSGSNAEDYDDLWLILENSTVYSSLGSVSEIVYLLTYWWVLVRFLCTWSFINDVCFQDEYHKNNSLIGNIIMCLNAIAFGHGPCSSSKENIRVILSEKVDRVLRNILKKNYDPHNNYIACSYTSGPESIEFQINPFHLPGTSELLSYFDYQRLLNELVRIEYCLDIYLKKIIAPSWNDYRTLGQEILPPKADLLEPVVNLFSFSPERVSYDKQLRASLYSLKLYQSDYLSDRMKTVLGKNDKLISNVKEMMGKRCPAEVEAFISDYIPVVIRIFEIWKKKRIEYEMLEANGEKTLKASFLKMIPGGRWPFPDYTIDDVVNVLRNDSDKRRVPPKIMNILINSRFVDQRYPYSLVYEWMETIKKKKNDSTIISVLNP